MYMKRRTEELEPLATDELVGLLQISLDGLGDVDPTYAESDVLCSATLDAMAETLLGVGTEVKAIVSVLQQRGI